MDNIDKNLGDESQYRELDESTSFGKSLSFGGDNTVSRSEHFGSAADREVFLQDIAALDALADMTSGNVEPSGGESYSPETPQDSRGE
jgi:hypothetical protein